MTSPDDALVEPSIAASAAAADSPGPPLSSDAPEAVQEPLGQPGPEQQQPEDDSGISAKAFNPRWKEPFIGLTFLGFLENTVTIYHHTFRLKTMGQRDKIRVGQLHKPYQGTLASESAYQTLLVAAYLHEVDGMPLPEPVTVDGDPIKERFDWVADNLRPPVIDRLFSEVLTLEDQVQQTLRAMGEA